MFGKIFSSLTTFTGGGGLSAPSSSSAGGDNTVASAFNFKTGAKSGVNSTVVAVGFTAFVAGFALAKVGN